MVMRQNVFGVYWSGLRWHLYKTGILNSCWSMTFSIVWLLLGAKNLNVKIISRKFAVREKLGLIRSVKGFIDIW